MTEALEKNFITTSNIKQNDLEKTKNESSNLIVQFTNEHPELPKELEELKKHDEHSHTHLADTAVLAYASAEHLNLSEEEKEIITLAAYLHDIGKKNIDINILNKTEQLSNEEYEVVKKHVEDGFNIVSKYDKDVANVIHYHHKSKKLFPYPADMDIIPDERIKRNISISENYENQIKKLGKILAIIDAYHAITSNRPYNKHLKNLSPKECKDIIIDELNLSKEDEKLIDYLSNFKNTSTE